MNKTSRTTPTGRLPPTTESLLDDTARPYFLWWTNTTVGQLKEYLASSDLEERAYWMGALLREANTRDVWLFVTPDEVRALWPRLIRYLRRVSIAKRLNHRPRQAICPGHCRQASPSAACHPGRRYRAAARCLAPLRE